MIPTKEMLCWLKEWRDYYHEDTVEKIDEIEQQTYRAIRALIMASRRTVTQELDAFWDEQDPKRTVSREEIRRLVQINWEYATATIADEATCDIWEERITEFLAELGINIDQGDVPVINEEGFSNEEKP